MKKIIASLCMAGLCLLAISSCRNLSYLNVFPEFYETDASDKGLMETDDVPVSLLSVLPDRFQLAYYSGHLCCYVDRNGSLSLFKANPRIQKAKKSAYFESLLSSAKADRNLIVFTPVAYPNVFCTIPDEDIDSLLADTYFPEWLVYFEQWQTAEELNMKLDSSLREMIIGNHESKKVISALESSITDYQLKIDQVNQRIRQIGPEINARRKKLGVPALESAAGFADGDKPVGSKPPFNFRIKYNLERDPFKAVIEKYTKDISTEKWATDQMQGGKYMDAELADKVKKANEQFADPESIKDPVLKSEVEALKAKGFNGINVTSGARTPYRQAHLYSEAPKNKNPVAKYVGSKHLFGQAADMALPDGWGWNSPDHQALRKVMGKMGLAMNVPNDPVHFAAAAVSQGARAQQLAMIRAYAKQAQAIKEGQEAIRDQQIFEAGKEAEQKQQLDKDVKAKKDEVEKQSSIFTRVSAKYNELQRESEALGAEIARRERQQRNGKDGREFPDRSRPSPASKESRPAPERPRERQRPSRETTFNGRLG